MINTNRRLTARQIEELRLPVEKLAAVCRPDLFSFATTTEVEPLEEGIIGQQRAIKSMEFGLRATHPGYHLFVTGPVGSGKTTYAMTKIRQIAKEGISPADVCYVYNFSQPDHPTVLLLPSGMGNQLKKDMKELIEDLRLEIRKAFEGEAFETRRTSFMREVEEQIAHLWKSMEEMAQKQGFVLQKKSEGIFTIPLNENGEPMDKESFESLGSEIKDKISKSERDLEAALSEALRKTRAIQKEANNRLKDIERETALYAAGHLVDLVREKYHDFPKVMEYLSRVQEDVVENLADFKGGGVEEEAIAATLLSLQKMQRNTTANRYEVCILVDNSEVRGAPVIIETNPTYYNLFGKIEYKGTFGSMITDFTMIKAGAVHQANGGYLILQALSVLTNPGAWEALKRVLKTREIRMENLGEQLGLVATSSLKPEPVPIKLKVVLIGNPRIYQALYNMDEDFRKFFKIRVDFDNEMERNEDNIQKYAAFISSVCQREELVPFNNEAVARIIDYSGRLVSHQEKLSTCFHTVKDIVIESALWAMQEQATAVGIQHVDRAVEEKQYRSNRLEEKIQEAMKTDVIFVDTDGYEIGQVNGLAVLNAGDYAFGKPSRITARTYLGREGIVNIERETQMSGKTHNKGVMILSAFFSSRFAQNKPLTLAASLTFEQLYEGVDGDSASSTELYALLSSLSGLPVYQGLAVTGSVNQKGEVQPIGGVNEKVEGFFQLCKYRGLNGMQGVIIPKANVKNLMLSNEVIEAAVNQKFNIYAISHVDQGIEILTGVQAGQVNDKGNYPAGTINYLVDNKLKEMALAVKNFGEKEAKNKRSVSRKGKEPN